MLLLLEAEIITSEILSHKIEEHIYFLLFSASLWLVS